MYVRFIRVAMRHILMGPILGVNRDPISLCAGGVARLSAVIAVVIYRLTPAAGPQPARTKRRSGLPAYPPIRAAKPSEHTTTRCDRARVAPT